jgi:oligopeptide/dipeptide ABC transporter ATP-binding protein
VNAKKRSDAILDVKNLSTRFSTDEGNVDAVVDVSFTVLEGEVFGLVGESGCGKSVTSLSIMGLVDSQGEILQGEIFFDGENLIEKSHSEMVSIRGSKISMIFQQPKTSLNPVFTIGDQIAEVFETHHGMEKEQAWQEVVSLLQQVGIPDPEEKALAHPHELSGGQAQRVMIAMALALNPQLLIADEPTTALDVTIQAQILELLKELGANMSTSVILITHDLGVVAEMADRVAVMYAGRIVEESTTLELFDNTLHPYTKGLMGSIPKLGDNQHRLDSIPGTVPNLIDLPAGCKFANRCKARTEHNLDICEQKEPNLINIDDTHKVRCWLYESSEDHVAPFQTKEVAS